MRLPQYRGTWLDLASTLSAWRPMLHHRVKSRLRRDSRILAELARCSQRPGSHCVGGQVSWPLEPCRYDLLVVLESSVLRVQVKTTTAREGPSWKVYLSKSGHGRRTYAPDEVDEFFIIDGELTYYRIPLAAVGGLHAIHLRAYQSYRLDNLGNPALH